MSEVAQPPWGEFGSLDELAAATLRDGRFSVRIDEGRFEAFLKVKPGRHLWVLLSAARDPARVTLPKFDRWSWHPMFPGPVLCVSDPTLYLDEKAMRIGWYVGTAEHDWQGALAALARHVAARLDVPAGRIIAYGSSAGGFGSLALAARLGRATAVAINPQTDVTRYAAPAVRRLLDTAFGGRTVDALTAGERRRLSAIALYEAAPDVRCLLVQNRLDRFHHRNHFLPFAHALLVPEDGGADPSGHLHALLYDSERGHAPERRDEAPAYIERALQLAELELPPRPVGRPRLVVDWRPANGLADAARLGLKPRRDGEAETDRDHWHHLDSLLAPPAPDVAAALAAATRWLSDDEAGAHGAAAWRPAPVAGRALRLAALLAAARQSAGPGAAVQSLLARALERHVHALAARALEPAEPLTPVELVALAALTQHLRGKAQRRWVVSRSAAALATAWRARFGPAGVSPQHAPAYQQVQLRAWQRCVDSGLFDRSPLAGWVAAAREADRWLRWPDGRALPLGRTPRREAAPAARVAFQERAGLRECAGHVISRDDGGGALQQASLLHLMGAQRPGGPPHGDALAVLWYEGAELLTEPGRPADAGGRPDPRWDDTAVHNTVEVGGDDGTATARVEVLDTAHLAGRAHASARRSGPGDAWYHLRHVVHAPGRWLLLVDVLRGRLERPWTRWLHLGPGLQPDDQGAWRLPDGRRLRIVTAANAALAERREQGLALPGGWSVAHRAQAASAVVATLLAIDDDAAGLQLDGATALQLRTRDGPVGTGLRLCWTRQRSRFAAPPAKEG